VQPAYPAHHRYARLFWRKMMWRRSVCNMVSRSQRVIYPVWSICSTKGLSPQQQPAVSFIIIHGNLVVEKGDRSIYLFDASWNYLDEPEIRSICGNEFGKKSDWGYPVGVIWWPSYDQPDKFAGDFKATAKDTAGSEIKSFGIVAIDLIHQWTLRLWLVGSNLKVWIIVNTRK
jgi:hypothetical protein